MMSHNRKDYVSASAWLARLRQDDLWYSQLQQLQNPTGNRETLYAAALRKIGNTETFELWDSYQHKVEPVVTEIWETELSLVSLKIQTIGMLSIEWLEKHVTTDTQNSEIIKKLKPIFMGNEQEAKAFLDYIQGLEPRQITAKVNQLVEEKKISELSRKHDLYTVLFDAGIYTKTESNWNMQVH